MRPDQVEPHRILHPGAGGGGRDLTGVVDGARVGDVPAQPWVDQRIQAFHAPAAPDEAGQVVAGADDVAVVVDAGARAAPVPRFVAWAVVDPDQAAVVVKEGNPFVEALRHSHVAGDLAPPVDGGSAIRVEAEAAQVAHDAAAPGDRAQRRFGEDAETGLAGDPVPVVQRQGLGNARRVLVGQQPADVPERAARRAQEAAYAGVVVGIRCAREQGGVAGVVDVGVGRVPAPDGADVALPALVVDVAALLATAAGPVAEHLALVVDRHGVAGRAAQRAQVDDALAAVDEAVRGGGTDRISADDHAGLVDVRGRAVGRADDGDPVFRISRGGMCCGQGQRQQEQGKTKWQLHGYLQGK